MAGLIDNVLENSISTGLKTNLQNAMSNVGVKVPSSTGLWQYPDIIRNNLVSKTVTGINILGKDIINIDSKVENNILTYNLSTIFDTYTVNRPNYAFENTKWGKNWSVQDVFNDLFNNILPAVRGVYAGDITITNINGEDTTEWKHELFNQTGIKTNLQPTSKYIRLYLTCQPEPLYIRFSSLIEDVTGGYNVKSSETVHFDINDIDNTITAHINIINDSQLTELGILNEVIENNEPKQSE